MKRLAQIIASALLVAAALIGYHTATAAAAQPARHTPVAAPYIPAPTTAAGFAQMFAALPVSEWGAADLALSVPMTAHRSVWLYGDTFSDNWGMVHSTAITEDGGRLHISNGGQQLLPNGGNDAAGRQLIYWIETAHRVDATHLVVAAEQVSIGSANSWDFHRAAAQDRTALLTVAANGDVTFTRWTGWVANPHIDTRFLGLRDGAPAPAKGQVFYAKHIHTEYRLADGHYLNTFAQNWSTPQKNAAGSDIRFSAYRPIFAG